MNVSPISMACPTLGEWFKERLSNTRGGVQRALSGYAKIRSPHDVFTTTSVKREIANRTHSRFDGPLVERLSIPMIGESSSSTKRCLSFFLPSRSAAGARRGRAARREAGRIWQHMAGYGGIWRDMAGYGQIWRDTSRYRKRIGQTRACVCSDKRRGS